MANMNYYGYFQQLQTPGITVEASGSPRQQLGEALRAAATLQARNVSPLVAKQRAAAETLNSRVKYALLKAQYRQKQLLAAAGNNLPQEALRGVAVEIAALHADEKQLKDEADRLTGLVTRAEAELRKNVAVFRDAQGRRKAIPLVDIVRFYCPNQMGLAAKSGHYAAKVWELLSTDPRESNQDGGLFPAIFGTVLMVFLMAALCFPLGVLAGIYLGEYAKQGVLVQLVRIAVNNLAGIPSIVYGIFGLGFFIYLVGGHLDAWIFPERVAASEPVYGQGCILWASLTLGLLTDPRGDRLHGRGLADHPARHRRKLVCPGGHEVSDLVARAGADGLAGDHDRLYPGDGPRGRRGGPVDVDRRGEERRRCRWTAVFPACIWTASSCTWVSTSWTSVASRPTWRRPSPWSM